MVLFTTGKNIMYFSQFADDNQNERYILPENLAEKMTICKPGEKPLVVIYLMKIMKYKGVLCFTGSIEATHRFV